MGVRGRLRGRRRPIVDTIDRGPRCRPPRALLVFGSVLARICVLPRVDRPVGSRRRPVPRSPVPFRVADPVGRLVVRGRPRRCLPGPPARWRSLRTPAGPPGVLSVGRVSPRRPRASPRPRPLPAGSVSAAPRPCPGALAGPARPPGVARGPGAGRVRLPRPIGPAPRASGRGATGGGTTVGGSKLPFAVDQPLVGRLDREEPGQRPFPGGIGVVLLGEPPIRGADLVEGRPGRDAEDPVRIALKGHGTRIRNRQPVSSPTGARSNSAMASAAVRP